MTPADRQKRRQLLLGLAGLTGLSLVGVGLQTLGTPRTSKANERSGVPVFSGFRSWRDTLRTVRVRARDTSYTLQREEAGWSLLESGGYPVRDDRVGALLAGLETLSWGEMRTSDPNKLDRIGLGAPEDGGLGAEIGLYRDDGKLAGQLITGRKASQLYGRKPNEVQSWTLLGDLPPVYLRSGWLDLNVVDTRPDVIASVRLKDERGEELVLRREIGGTVRDFEPGQGSGNVELTSRIVASAPALALSRFSPIDVKPSSALQSGPVYKHTTITFDSLEVEVTAYADPDGYFVTLRAIEAGLAADQAASINRRSEGWAFQLEPYDWNDFTMPLSDLIRPSLR